jgi:CRISPR-associated protein (TIGR02710 family)
MMKEAEFATRLARMRAIETSREEYEGGSGREYALRYYLTEMLDEVVRQATARSDLRAAPVSLLISLVGFSPVTTILSYELLRPQRLLVVTSADAEESVDVIADYVVAAGRLRHRDFMHRLCNPTDPHGIYRAVKAELEGSPSVASQRGEAVIDITGGRKVMSAAAALAAWQLNLRLCYIETEWDPARRQAVPGSDRLLLLDNPTTIFGEQGMDEALQLFAGGAFEAARRRYASLCDSLADPRRARFMRALSEFYRAWCDLDLASISECAGAVETALKQTGTEISQETADRVSGQLEFVRRLGRDGERDSFLMCFYVLGEHYRELARHDFAALLYYRTIEGCLSRQLERRAAGFSCERPNYSLLTDDVDALQRSYGAVLEHSGRKDPNPALPPSVGLIDAAYLLNVLDDDLIARCHIKGVKALSHLNRLAATRNRSVLAHGEQAVRQTDCVDLGRKARLVLRAYWDDRGAGPPADDIVSSLRFVRSDR